MTFNDHVPFMISDFNDTNTVVRMTVGHKTVAASTTWLFLGDSCIYQSRYLCVMYGDYLQSDIVQMAHHGNIGCEIALYETVSPTVLFFSHRLSSYYSYTRDYSNVKNYQFRVSKWPYNVDYHVAHKIESLKYIYTGGHTNCLAVAIAFQENGALDYDTPSS